MIKDKLDSILNDCYNGLYSSIEIEKLRAIKKARTLFLKEDWLIIDTETTGLDYNDQIIEIAIVDNKGKCIFESRIKPSCKIHPKAQEVHGISLEDLKDAPTFSDIYPDLCRIIKGRNIYIYNAKFDFDKMQYSCEKARLASPFSNNSFFCIMELYAQYYGEYNEYYRSFTWQKLKGNHTAKGDAIACYNLLKRMAETFIFQKRDEPKMFPPLQVFGEWKSLLTLNVSINNFKGDTIKSFGIYLLPYLEYYWKKAEENQLFWWTKAEKERRKTNEELDEIPF